MKKLSFVHTLYASYLAYITQAIVNNFVPLLFLTFASDLGLTLDKIALITTLNFGIQLAVDFLSPRVIDKVGYRCAIMAGHAFSCSGLLGLVFLPSLLGYAGVLLSVVFYAIGGGIIEVLVSPIVEACPTEKKEAAMSLLHSFYCWGHVAVVVCSTLFFTLFGIENWRICACLWALIPLGNLLYFFFVPLYALPVDQDKNSFRALSRQKMFWLLLVVMICAGASEQAMSQWASAFAESGLHVSKTMGDLLGPCAFAAFMGCARAIYGKCSEKIPLKAAMLFSGVLCILSYLLAVAARQPLLALVGCALCGFSVGIFWPGTFSMASWNIRGGGTLLYAWMALAGDVGCAAGPTVVGFMANGSGGNLKVGLACAILFPLCICFMLPLLKGKAQEKLLK